MVVLVLVCSKPFGEFCGCSVEIFQVLLGLPLVLPFSSDSRVPHGICSRELELFAKLFCSPRLFRPDQNSTLCRTRTSSDFKRACRPLQFAYLLLKNTLRKASAEPRWQRMVSRRVATSGSKELADILQMAS